MNYEVSHVIGHWNRSNCNFSSFTR